MNLLSAKILDGNAIAKKVFETAKSEVEKLREIGIKPKLVVIQVGSNEASTIYTQKKHDACASVGILSEIIRLNEATAEQELLSQINELNKDDKVNGILVQLPLPKHINESKIIESILPEKDVDGFHPVNQGKNLLHLDGLRPATPKGVMRLLNETGQKLEGLNAVVIGRSSIVGKPLAIMLLNSGCTVTICHSKTKDLKSHLMKADLIVSAVGKPKLVKASMVKKGAIVIDVGISRDKNGKLCGDVDFQKVKKKASWITPVPGGVGPMTIASLIENTIKACKNQWLFK